MPKKRYTTLTLVALAVSALLYVTSRWLNPSEVPAVGPEATAWNSRRHQTLSDPCVVRHYSFQDRIKHTLAFNNSAGWDGTLKPPPTELSDASAPPVQLVEGRWPWKQAVHLDQMPLEASPIPVEESQFSAEIWFRHQGEGVQPGGNFPTGGTLIAMGDGVRSGWKIAFYYPCQLLTFEIGRPKPEQPAGVMSMSRIPPNVWTHVVCTWDGSHMHIYINGLLTGRVAYSGEYFAVKPYTKFRVGYVGNGLGSVRFDIDELVLYQRCLTAQEIASRFVNSEESGDIPDQITPAGKAFASGRTNEALRIYRSILENKNTSPDIKALVSLRIGECYRESEDYDLAFREFAAVASNRNIRQSIRHFALLESLAMEEGVAIDSYRPKPASSDHDWINPWEFCHYSNEYARALETFHLSVNEEYAEQWTNRLQHDIRPILQQHCVSCHGNTDPEGNLNLEDVVREELAVSNGSLWTTVQNRVQNGDMPPPSEHAMAKEDRSLLLHWLKSRPLSAFCEEIATDHNQRFYPGYVFSRRLTRLEYSNAIRDLTGEELPPDALPPVDGSGGEGFDNVGDILFTSSLHMESYIRTADEVIDRAIERELTRTSEPCCVLNFKPDDLSADFDDEGLAHDTISSFARRVWRRPVQKEEVTRLLSLFHDARHTGNNFVESLKIPLKAILISPHFLYVVETEPQVTGVQRLTPHQLATRLALFLWSTVPDEELLQLADSGDILGERTLRQQIQRMLNDHRSSALGSAFGLQWLQLTRTPEEPPDKDIFPDFTEQLSEDMVEEAERFVADLFQNNRPLTNLIDADYVMINERLGLHYEISLPSDSGWQTVAVDGKTRGGILTMGAVLTASSYPHRTSPVLRGKWILHQILGSYVSPPPPDTPSLEETSARTTSLSLREQLEQHRSDIKCATCHQTMDPLGFSLENYDAIGRWREYDNGQPIDATGLLPSGIQVNGVSGLKAALLERSDEFLEHFVRKLLGFALGRSLNHFDDCTVRRCLKHLKNNDLQAKVLLEQIVLSHAFQYRYFAPSELPDK